MNRIAWIIIALVVIAAIMFGIWYTATAPTQPDLAPSGAAASSAAVSDTATSASGTPMTLVTTAIYRCDGGKAITASFYRGPDAPVAAGQQPVPNGQVVLTLSDGSTLILPQTASADGARYADAREAFIFWSRGQTALTQGPDASGYANCAVAAQ